MGFGVWAKWAPDKVAFTDRFINELIYLFIPMLIYSMCAYHMLGHLRGWEQLRQDHSLCLQGVCHLVWETDKEMGTPTGGQVRSWERKRPGAFWEPTLKEIRL